MHHYLVIHTIKQYPETQDEWLDSWGNVLEKLGGNTRWIHSFYDPEDEQLYCIWQAESEDEIRSRFSESGIENAPIDEIREVAYFDIGAWSDNANGD